MQPSTPIRHISVCAGVRAFFPLVGISAWATARSAVYGCPLRPGSLHPFRAGASSVRGRADSLPPSPLSGGGKPHGHKGTVSASKMMGPLSGGRLPRCLATPRSERFFMIILRGQRDTPASSPCGGQDVR